ncbi:hypothetical protein [Butyrivibrio sp. AC2005]|nr:hypothetical protein [Butyrivibrio sp. AC2005]
MRNIFESIMEEFGFINAASYHKPFGRLDASDYNRIEAELIRFADNVSVN